MELPPHCFPFAFFFLIFSVWPLLLSSVFLYPSLLQVGYNVVTPRQRNIGKVINCFTFSGVCIYCNKFYFSIGSWLYLQYKFGGSGISWAWLLRNIHNTIQLGRLIQMHFLLVQLLVDVLLFVILVKVVCFILDTCTWFMSGEHLLSICWGCGRRFIRHYCCARSCSLTPTETYKGTWECYGQ